MAHGGARLNTGPKGRPTFTKEEQSQFRSLVSPHIEEYHRLMHALAQGVTLALRPGERLPRGTKVVESETVEDLEGEEWIAYRTAPDKAALKFLIEMSEGKAAAQDNQTPDSQIVFQVCMPRPETPDDPHYHLPQAAPADPPLGGPRDYPGAGRPAGELSPERPRAGDLPDLRDRAGDPGGVAGMGWPV